jgi:molybdate transport system ATP-binding protein
MIQARIRKQYPPGPESAGFSLDIDLLASAGVTVLFGPSGSGKTMTLEAIAGFIRPDEGRILLDEEILFDAGSGLNLPPQRRHCGYVFQNYALFPHMTLRENLAFAASSSRKRWARLERHRRVNEMLERFHLAEVSGRRAHEVSGGQKQRCSIARALIAEPKLLLLDEPARGLDAPLRAELYGVLRKVRAEFLTPILLVTHDLEECFQLGDEMVVLHEGRIVQRGMPRQVYDRPANVEVARQLGTYNLLPVEIILLDPVNKTSRIRYGDFQFSGPYFPGRFKGDRVTLCVRPEELVVAPADGKPGANQLAAELARHTERPQSILLEFRGDLYAEVSHAHFERHKHVKEWVVEFPPAALRVL